MKFILGKKQNMTQVFTEDGRVHPATIISAGPIVVTQQKNLEKDGYVATQFGYEVRSDKKVAKAQLGHTGKLGSFRYIKEFRNDGDNKDLNIGDTLDISAFEVGDVVEVSAISKGKGFQGVVKRHGFAGGPRSHGQKHSEREPGSIGSTGPQRVFKGTRMGGRMGSDRVTVKNLKVLQVNKEANVVVIGGAIPGRRGTLVEITSK